MRIALDPPPGLQGDDTSYSAAGRWAAGSNVRFRLGRAQAIGGWEKLIQQALPGVCRSAFAWTDGAPTENIAFGDHRGLSVWMGGALFDITPTTGFNPGAVDGAGGAGFGTGAYSAGTYSTPVSTDYFPLTWSLAAWGEQLIACPRRQTLFLWANNPAAPAVPVAGAPAQVTYALVAPQDQVFALGCNEEVSGDFNALCLRHSSVRNLTEWRTGPATTARE